jgi:hypothetical protein
MAKIVTAQTEMAQWYELVQEAVKKSHCTLDEEMEGYLVLMLMRYARQPEMADRVMAMEYLQALLAGGSIRSEQLREVGDQCLLYSGLFPKRAQKRLVKVRYYIDLGRSSYHQVAEGLQKSSAQLYARLAKYFVHLMEVLHSMRGFDRDHSFEPLLLHELWNECGSEQALQQLEQKYNITPFRMPGGNENLH